MITLSEQTIKALVNVITGNQQRAPYRTGSQLVKFFNSLGWSDVYEDFPARHKYVEAKLQEINGTPKVEQVIAAGV